MNKCFIVTALLAVANVCFAQVDSTEQTEYVNMEQRKPLLHWNLGLGCSIGFNHIHNRMKGDEFVALAPRNTVEFDFNIAGVYLGFDLMSRKTGYDVYGYDEKVGVFAFKIGPSWRVDLKDKSALHLTPFVGWGNVEVKDTSENSIGARTDYGSHASGFLVGGKLAYVHKGVEYSVHGSNRDVGIGIGCFVDLPF